MPFQFVSPTLFSRPTLDRPRQTQLTECLPGAPCLNVVDMEMGVTTAREVHWSGSWPTWMACVAKCWKLGRKPWGETPFFCMLSCEGRRQEKGEEDNPGKLGRDGAKEARNTQASRTYGKRSRQRRAPQSGTPGSGRDFSGPEACVAGGGAGTAQ